MTKIIVSILAFLLMIFPNSKYLIEAHQARTNTPSIVAPQIIEAFKSKNISALEVLMCQNIKTNVSDLRTKIGEMMDAIDSEIIEATWTYRGGSYLEKRGDGKKISQQGFEIYLTTSTKVFTIPVWWETINNFSPKEIGIRGIALRYPVEVVLYRIYATNGISDWHD